MTHEPISRRGMLTGIGAAGGAAFLPTVGTGHAVASPIAPGPNSTGGADGAGGATPHAGTTALATPISSALAPGVQYLFKDFEEFEAETIASGRTWGGQGVYTPNSTGLLSVSFDLPPGARLYDVEWYVYNNSSSGASCLLRIYSAGSGQFLTVAVDTTVPANAGMVAQRAAVPSTSNGPFASGTRAVAALYTPTDGTIQINGVRVGYTKAPLRPVLLPTPARIVDSRTSGGALTNTSRTISLAGQTPVGALGALVNLTVVNTVTSGYLALTASGSTATPTSTVHWFASNQTVANQATTAISSSRTITLTAHGSTQFIVDLIGYLI